MFYLLTGIYELILVSTIALNDDETFREDKDILEIFSIWTVFVVLWMLAIITGLIGTTLDLFMNFERSDEDGNGFLYVYNPKGDASIIQVLSSIKQSRVK